MLSPYLAYYFDNVNLTGINHNYWGDEDWYVDDALIAGVFQKFIDFHVQQGTLEYQSHSSVHYINYEKVAELPLVDQAIFLKWVRKLHKKNQTSKSSVLLRFNATPKIMRLTTKVIVKYAYYNELVQDETKEVVTLRSGSWLLWNSAVGGILVLFSGSTATNAVMSVTSALPDLSFNPVNAVVGSAIITVGAGYFGFKRIKKVVTREPITNTRYTGHFELSEGMKHSLLYEAARDLESERLRLDRHNQEDN